MIHDLLTLKDARQKTMARVAGLPLGTRVLTLRGEVRIETLAIGDKIIARSGAITIRNVQRESHDTRSMVRVSASSLGVDLPGKDIIVSPEQMFVIAEPAADGSLKSLISASDLIDGLTVCPETVQNAELVVLEFDTPTIIYAGNAELATG
jgi:hypothetical protein